MDEESNNQSFSDEFRDAVQAALSGVLSKRGGGMTEGFILSTSIIDANGEARVFYIEGQEQRVTTTMGLQKFAEIQIETHMVQHFT